MSQVNANSSSGAEDFTREASGEAIAPRGGDRSAAGGRRRCGQGRGS
ncbi:hypothetical protein [Sorangium cellulosum]|nr:hypothetical protein [Sorangium cellulosum]